MQDIISVMKGDDEAASPNLIVRTANSLRNLADQLEQGSVGDPVEWTIPMADIGTVRMNDHCDAIAARFGRKRLAVYAICFDDKVPLERVYEVVDRIKVENKALPVEERTAFARINNRKDCLGSKCLYVGKSEKVAARLKEHLTQANRATYAIHMDRWPCDLPGNLIIRVIEVEGVASSMLPFLEDQLAGEMPPILGKRGSV